VPGLGAHGQHHASFGDESPKAVIARDGARCNEVGNGPAADRHTNALSPAGKLEHLAQSRLELADTDFAHVDTLARNVATNYS
jgi:hypothetical protein